MQFSVAEECVICFAISFFCFSFFSTSDTEEELEEEHVLKVFFFV